MAGADLTTRGYHSQVQLQDDSLALFHLDGSRRPIRQHNGQFVVGDEMFRLGPGSYVAAPPGVLHGFRVVGDGELRMLNIHTPNTGFAARMRSG